MLPISCGTTDAGLYTIVICFIRLVQYLGQNN